MKNVELLLRETVPHLGKVGDVVRVAPGYARNYLEPRRIGVRVTPDAVAAMQKKRAEYDIQEAAKLAEAAERAEALSKIVLKSRQKSDDNGRLYGSVNAAAVARLLSDFGFPVDEKDVRLATPIKTVGEHPVQVHVHGDLSGSVTVIVEPETPLPVAAAPTADTTDEDSAEG